MSPSPAATPAGTGSRPLLSLKLGISPRNCTVSATISTAWRLVSSAASHSRHSRRPSIATGRPLERCFAPFSPCAPQTVTLKKLGLSAHSPSASLRRVLHATRRLQTDVPLGSVRRSGSAVRLPVRTTRLMLTLLIAVLLLVGGAS